MKLILILIIYWISKAQPIVIICDLKHSDVGYGHFDTCEASVPPIDTSASKIVESAIGWSKSRTTDDVKQLYTEFVNCVHFPYDLSKVFPQLEIVRLFQSKVKYVEVFDLKNLVNLKVLDLEDNHIEVLQADLFQGNHKLREIRLDKNKIKFISPGVFNSINLIVLNLEGNKCISGKAVNDVVALLDLKNMLEDSCTAPEFLLQKNSQFIRQTIDLNFTLSEVTKRKDSCEKERTKVKTSASACEEEKENIQNENFRLNSQIKKDGSSINKLKSEFSNLKELNDALLVTNTKLTKEIRRSNEIITEADEKIYDLITNRNCSNGQEDSIKEHTLKYENKKLLQEISELKFFKVEIERDLRAVILNCQYVTWNKMYTCQCDKLLVKIDDAEVTTTGKHASSKSNYDVKKIFINSKDAKVVFLPVNFGAVFQQLQVLIIDNSNLVSIKIENFDNMPELKELIMDRNSIEEIPYDTFTYPQKMEKLSMAFNKIKALDKDTFKYLKNLKYLILSNNRISKIHKDLFKSNDKIELIVLQNNKINHLDPRSFETLLKLRTIDLDTNPCVNGSFIIQDFWRQASTIGTKCSLPESQEIFCKYQDLNSMYTCTLDDLTVVNEDVDVSKISGDHPNGKSHDDVKQLLGRRQNMKYFPSGLSSFFKNLEILDVKNSELMAVNENDFRGLSKLKELLLSNNKIKIVNENGLNDLVNLEIINLSANQITDLLDNTFTRLTKLKVLDISANKIQKLSQRLLAANGRLEKLNASGNKLSFIAASLLINKSSLKEVNFIANVCIDDKMPDTPIKDFKLKILDQCQQI